MNPRNTQSSLIFKVPACTFRENNLYVDLTDEQEPYDKDTREGKQELVTEEIKLRERHQRFVTDRHISKNQNPNFYFILKSAVVPIDVPSSALLPP